MSDPQNPSTDPKPTAPAGDPKPDPKGNDPLGDNGKKALEAERDARKQAEADLKALRGEFDGFKKSLTEAFGVKPDNGNDDALGQVQQQLAAMQHESLVYRLAAQHHIDDEGDLDLLKAATAEHAPKLAERLAAKAEAETKPGTPKPDATQAGGAGGTTPPALNSDALTDALKAAVGAR